MLVFLVGCGSSRKISSEDQRVAASQNNNTDQNAYQTELKRNWSFGFENYKNRRYQEVPHFFWRVVEMDTAKTLTDVYSFLANTYIKLNKPDSAILVYQLGTQALPENSQLYRGLANLFASRDRKDEAITQYQKLVALRTAEENDYRKLSDLFLDTADTLRAVETLEIVQALAPDDLEVRQRLSMLYPAGNHHAHDDVLELKLRQQQNPNDAPTLLALGKAHYHRGEYSECAETIEQYIELMPGDSFAREFLGEAYLALHRIHDAVAQFEIILAGNADNPEALAMLGRCHNELKEWAAARRCANQALAIDDKFGFAYLVLGEIYESAARECGISSEFSRKLVFRLAYEQYQHAQIDPKFQNEAKRRMKGLEPLLPIAKDYFTNKNQDRPAGECYSWIYK